MAVAYLLGTALIRDNQVERGQHIVDRILSLGDSAEARLLIGTTKMMARDYRRSSRRRRKGGGTESEAPECSFLSRPCPASDRRHHWRDGGVPRGVQD